MSKKIGIDLGTTYSLASYVNAAGSPELIPNAEGSFLTPSVVWINGSHIEAGEPALNMAVAEPEYLAVQMKRNMGDESYRFHGMTATDVATQVLRKLKRDAETFFKEEVSAAAITVPAYFTDPPLKATKKAGEQAGLEVLALPKEPTAAALYYGTAQMKNGEKLLVYDLGGGTMDATVLAYSQSCDRTEFTVLSSDGSRDLGGEDWTARLVEFVEAPFEKEFGVSPKSDWRMKQTVFEACERAKRMLTIENSAKVVMAHGGKTLSVPITCAGFEDASSDLLEQAMLKAEGALEKAGLGWGGLSRVLLVGGATRMKAVTRSLKARSGVDPIAWGNTDQLVALGAALYTFQRVNAAGGIEILAGPRGGGIAVQSREPRGVVITLKESTTHGLGTIVVEKGGARRLVSSVIIRPQTPIPVKSDRSDYQTQPHQTEVDVPVIQADEDGLDPGRCAINKTYRFAGIPDRPAPSPVCVIYHYDKDNIIDVSAVDTLSGQELEKTIIEFALPTATFENLNVVFVLDTSISMGGEPLSQLKVQVQMVCDELEQKGGRVGIVEFGAGTGVVCAPTGDYDRVRRDVSGLRAGGSTPMAEGIAATTNALREIQGRRVAIVVSDGLPNSQSGAREEANRLKELGVVVYTISIGTTGADFLKSIGDAYTQVQSAGDLAGAIGKLLWSK